MADQITMLQDLINPEVMAGMINAKLQSKIRVLPYATVDTSLQGQAGDTVTIPKFEYIGDAVDVAEGAEIPARKISTTSKSYKIKKAGNGVTFTDEAVLSAHGGEQLVASGTTQLTNSISAKCDVDAMDELLTASTAFVSTSVLDYDGIVDAIDLFEEEVNTDKVMFVHPKQVTQLRKDPDFISREKYGNQVMMDGEIGMIGNARIVPSKKVKHFEANKWYVLDTSGADTIVESGASTNQVNLADVLPSIPNAQVGQKVTKQTKGAYFCPIMKTENDTESEDDTPALTYFIKRDTNVETERVAKKRLTEVTADQMYTVALTNDAKVVVLKCADVASV